MIERVDFVQDGHRLGANWAAVVEVADTGVDYVAVGALTHSVKALDIGADLQEVAHAADD